MQRKKDGFKGQKAIVLPISIQEVLYKNPVTKFLFVTDIGFYPEAKYHFRERKEGSMQNILIYCTNGKGWVDVNGTNRKVLKDQFFIIPAGAPHKYGSDNDDPWTIYWLHFTGDISRSFVNPEFTIINLDPVKNTRNDRRIRLFEELYQNLTMGYGKENLEYASMCLWYLLGSFNYIPQFERIRGVQQSDIIERSIVYMHNNIENVINLVDLATLCGYSVSHYSLVFKKKTSHSPIGYFNNLKIQRACQLLDFSGLHIKEIALQLNFEDQFYFSRVFKRVMGISPLEYRKKKKG